MCLMMSLNKDSDADEHRVPWRAPPLPRGRRQHGENAGPAKAKGVVAEAGPATLDVGARAVLDAYLFVMTNVINEKLLEYYRLRSCCEAAQRQVRLAYIFMCTCGFAPLPPRASNPGTRNTESSLCSLTTTDKLYSYILGSPSTVPPVPSGVPKNVASAMTVS